MRRKAAWDWVTAIGGLGMNGWSLHHVLFSSRSERVHSSPTDSLLPQPLGLTLLRTFLDFGKRSGANGQVTDHE